LSRKDILFFSLCFVGILLTTSVAASVTWLPVSLSALSHRLTPPLQGAALAASTKTPRPTFTPRIAVAARPTSTAAATPTAGATPAEQQAAVAVAGRSEPVAAQTGTLNGVPIAQIIVLPEAVQRNITAIYAKGQTLGRNPRAFSKVGDSTMVWPAFLAVFDNPAAYRLGPFAALQTDITYFSGSFARTSIAVERNMHTWGMFDSSLADNTQCKSGEGPLDCELRLSNSSLAIIRLGVNDAYVPDAFETNMRKIIETCLADGVIPILGTKPDRLEGPDNTINKIIYRLADTYQIPLWDYDLIAGTVPGKGLDQDNMHFLAGGPHDYSNPDALDWADSLEDLTGLMMLDAVYRDLHPGS
jgi:hypothetical protein